MRFLSIIRLARFSSSSAGSFSPSRRAAAASCSGATERDEARSLKRAASSSVSSIEMLTKAPDDDDVVRRREDCPSVNDHRGGTWPHSWRVYPPTGSVLARRVGFVFRTLLGAFDTQRHALSSSRWSSRMSFTITILESSWRRVRAETQRWWAVEEEQVASGSSAPPARACRETRVRPGWRRQVIQS